METRLHHLLGSPLSSGLRHVIQTVLIIAFSNFCYCFTNSFESIKTDDLSFFNDEKIDSLNKKAWEIANYKLDSFYLIGLQLDTVGGNSKILARCYSNQIIGAYYYYTSQLDSALQRYNDALYYRNIIGDSTLISSTYNNIGSIYLEMGKYIKAIDYLFESLSTTPISDSVSIGSTISNISLIYLELGKYKKSLEYVTRAKEYLSHNMDYRPQYISAIISEGNIYLSMNHFENAMNCFETAENYASSLRDSSSLATIYQNVANVNLKTGAIDTAIYNFNRAYEIYKKHDFEYGQAEIEHNMGISFRLLGNLKESFLYLNKSLQKWKSFAHDEMIAHNYTDIAKTHLLNNEYSEALSYFLLADSYHFDDIDLDFNIAEGIARSFEGKGEFENAIPYRIRCLSIQDSLNNAKIQWKNLESEYVQNRSKIEVLEKEKELLVEQNRKNELVRFSIYGAIFSALLIFGLLINNIRVRQKRDLIKKESDLQRKELETSLQDQELKSIRDILETQDQERKRISKDLHDNIGNSLAILKMRLNNLAPENDEKKDDSFILESSKNLDRIIDDVRKISHNLSSGLLVNAGLIPAVQELINKLEQSSTFKIELITHQFESRVDSKLEIDIYRIFQELISNIIKHASADEIVCQLLKKEKSVFMEVSDNGVGFNAIEHINSGIGFKNINSRLSKYSGTIEIDSSPNHGTTVFINIPI